MKSAKLLRTIFLLFAVLAVLNLPNLAGAQADEGDHRFEVNSSTFAKYTTLPISTIQNIISNGVNVCSTDGSVGGNQSPELSWTNAPRRTRTFVAILYDATAAYTHWGMYNIPATTTDLPENAGAAGSTYGTQIYNDAFLPEYDGPCPPPNYPPNVHYYVFTVYALDTKLQLPGSTNFPPGSETLYRALIDAGRHDHILATASITGLYSTTPGN